MTRTNFCKSKVIFTVLVSFIGMVGSANAALVYLDTFSKNECRGGFKTCYATKVGTQQGKPTDPDLLGSPTVYKLDSNNNAPTGKEDFGAFYPSIEGEEFEVKYVSATNTLQWEYNPGLDDPNLHYVAIFQAGKFALFYDDSPITSGSVALDSYFLGRPGWSHITFFNSGSTTQVPEPISLALLGVGLLGVGAARLRAKRVKEG